MGTAQSTMHIWAWQAETCRRAESCWADYSSGCSSPGAGRWAGTRSSQTQSQGANYPETHLTTCTQSQPQPHSAFLMPTSSVAGCPAPL